MDGCSLACSQMEGGGGGDIVLVEQTNSEEETMVLFYRTFNWNNLTPQQWMSCAQGSFLQSCYVFLTHGVS